MAVEVMDAPEKVRLIIIISISYLLLQKLDVPNRF